MAKPRRSLSEAVSDDLTPEMEAFRKGGVSDQEQPSSPVVPDRKLQSSEADEDQTLEGKKRKLVVELDADLYHGFATACLKNRVKMAKLVRQWIAEYTQKNQ